MIPLNTSLYSGKAGGESKTQQCVIEQAGCTAGLDVTTEFTTWLERHLRVLPDQKKKEYRRESSLSSFKKKYPFLVLSGIWIATGEMENSIFFFFDTSVVWSTVGMGVPILLDRHRFTFQLRGDIDFMSNTPSELYVPTWSFLVLPLERVFLQMLALSRLYPERQCTVTIKKVKTLK